MGIAKKKISLFFFLEVENKLIKKKRGKKKEPVSITKSNLTILIVADI